MAGRLGLLSVGIFLEEMIAPDSNRAFMGREYYFFYAVISLSTKDTGFSDRAWCTAVENRGGLKTGLEGEKMFDPYILRRKLFNNKVNPRRIHWIRKRWIRAGIAGGGEINPRCASPPPRRGCPDAATGTTKRWTHRDARPGRHSPVRRRFQTEGAWHGASRHRPGRVHRVF